MSNAERPYSLFLSDCCWPDAAVTERPNAAGRQFPFADTALCRKRFFVRCIASRPSRVVDLLGNHCQSLVHWCGLWSNSHRETKALRPFFTSSHNRLEPSNHSSPTDSCHARRRHRPSVSSVFRRDCRCSARTRNVCLSSVQDGADDLDKTLVPLDDVSRRLGTQGRRATPNFGD